MVDHHLHIVCFDVPYPVDYGGIFDLYYKIVALHRQGIKIHLHCFEYGRGKPDELNKYCTEVFLYKRKFGLKGFSLHLPYIVSSRINDELPANLLKDDYPVLLEGIHTTYYLHKNRLLNKKVFVRLHNVEFEYYKQLAKSETSLLKKLYFLHESMQLKKYEKKIATKAIFIAVALPDKEIYEKVFHAKAIEYLPVFLPYTLINGKEGKGNYCLYHGNLSIAENEKAIIWVLENIFNKLSIPLVIAGKNPSKKLERLADRNTNTCVVANPTEQELTELISEAQINILPSFNSTGIKIKLLNAIFNGRHCLVNTAAIKGTGLKAVCTVSDDSRNFKENIIELYNRSFTKEEVILRRKMLLPKYDNEKNAWQLIQWIY